mmetsp:Transcript_117970/g.338345  ORF Transcript_117970/g.338345 Transcript_117970/m.338345 type:complete len:305 (+) Transcript_117970:131-1045(+)
MSSDDRGAPQPKRHALVAGLAGLCSGATEAAITMPFNTLKTYCQVQKRGLGLLASTKEIYSLQGMRGFYFGFPVVLLQAAGKSAVRWCAYEQLKASLQAAGAPKASVDFAAGLGAGLTEALLWTTPTDRLKVLRQNEIRSGQNRYSSLIGAARVVATEHGITGLYASIGACGIRQASGVGVRFAIYGRLKAALTTDPPQIWQSALAGGVTGLASTTLNQPLDVIKTRLEAQDGARKEYTSTLQCFRRIVAEEGVSALYRGITPRMVKVSMGQAILFSAYERYTDLIEVVGSCLATALVPRSVGL